MMVREVTGFGNAESGGNLFIRVLNLTVASVAAGASTEQTFTAGLSLQLLGSDVLITAHASSAAQTSGIFVIPGRVTSIGSVGLDIGFGAGSTTATAAAPLTAAFYNLVFLRR